MSLQRAILVTGIAVLAAGSAASISLDVKSRANAASVGHTLAVLSKVTDVRLLLRRAESAKRGYLVSDGKDSLNAYHESFDQIAPAPAALKDAANDNPTQVNLVESSEPLRARRFAAINGAIARHASIEGGGSAAAKAESGVLIGPVDFKFDQFAQEEQTLLGIRSTRSETMGKSLLAINLCCAGLIMILAGLLIRDWRGSSRQQESLQRAAKAENEALEITITERTEHLVEAYEGLRHSTSMLDAIFANMAEAVLVIDNDGEIALANAAAGRMLRCRSGMTVAQWQTENVACHPDGSTHLAPNESPAARALCGEQFDGVATVVRRADGDDPIYLVASGRPLLDGSGAIDGASLVFRDVTAAREIERKLHQSQKLDAIGKLTGGVAHDFNNMLTIIAGNTEMLVEKLHDRPDLQAVAALINQAADRCTELIQHLLAFARKQPLQPRNVDINLAVLDITRLLRPTLGEQVEVVSILGAKVPTALVDHSQLANALINLAVNARDAMPDGGKLMVETGNVVLDETYAQANGEVRPGAYVMIAVTDTGTGMSAAICEKAFEPFFTTKEMGRGTGLGLSMVYGFVRQSCGHIKIHSELGQGTTIRLYLPATDGLADAAVPAGVSIPGAGETIMVVEDDELVRGFVIAQLHGLGYRTIAVANGQEALALLDGGQRFDLLFTDVVMPGGMTGRQLADEVVKRRPGTKVLYTSGYTENAIVHQGRLDLGVMLLSKPYRKSALAGMVRLALGDAIAENDDPGSILLADTSSVVPMRRPAASGQALSLG